MATLAVVSIYAACFHVFAHGANPLPEQELIQHLMTNYSKDIRPVADVTKAVQLSVGAILLTLDLDVSKNVLSTTYWPELTWTAENLVWDPADFHGINLTYLDQESVWRPDMQAYNECPFKTVETHHARLAQHNFSIVGDVAALRPQKVVVQYQGTVTWIPALHVRTSCHADLTYFPYDVQNCSIKVGPWVYNGFQLNLTVAHDLNLAEYQPSVEYSLEATTTRLQTLYYECCPQPYQSISYSFVLRRRSGRPAAAVLGPALLLSLAALAALWLPADRGARPLLSAVLLLAVILLKLFVGSFVLPRNSAHTPIIETYLLALATLICATLISSIVMMQLAQRRPASAEGSDVEPLVESERKRADMSKVGRIDRVLFMLFLILFIVVSLLFIVCLL